MKSISPDSFALLCFLTLMQGGRGLIDKSPDYITEKAAMRRRGLDAFAYLDIHNMAAVVEYCGTWGIELPEQVAAEWQRQITAAKDLADQGIVL
jgi:hypothetical protein